MASRLAPGPQSAPHYDSFSFLGATTYVMESHELRMPSRSKPSAAPPTTNGATWFFMASIKPPTARATYRLHGTSAYHSHSSRSASYPVWRRTRWITLTANTRPPTPHASSAMATGPADGHGALMIVEMSRAPPRCATVGVPKA